jgi:hypothetical protein
MQSRRNLADVSEVLTASIIRAMSRQGVTLLMEAVSASEASVNFY